MALRIISAFVALPVFIITIFFLPPLYFTIAIGIICLIAVYELLWRSKIITDPVLFAIACVFSTFAPIWAHFGFKSQFVLPGVFVITAVLFVTWMARLKTVNFEKITAVLFGAVVVPAFLSSTIGILGAEHGRLLILVPFIGAWMSDTGAYFSGTFFGKHKLAPAISPKKTVEGAVGGIVVCVASFIVYGVI
ncbi:MAG: phosphatidate cytidylyltransferase, partial [Clostridia bacterium]